MIGKYRAEVGLNVFSSRSKLIPVEFLSSIIGKDDNNYHIYAILATDEYYINLEKTTKTKEYIHFVLNRVNGTELDEIPLLPFLLSKELDHTKIEVLSNYPYDRVSLQIKDEDFLSQHPNYANKKFTYLSNSLLDICSSDLIKRQKYEVLYIGQAYGKDGSRTALDRLSTHETLQTILSEKNICYPNKHIYIHLIEIQEQQILLFDGLTQKVSKSDDESVQHIKDVISDLPREKQVINITEAALINFFKPVYNEKLTDNFPNPQLKGYRQYFDLDYNSLTIGLELDFENGQSIELYTDFNSMKSSFDFVRYSLHNDSNRINMYEIFGEPLL